MQLRDIEKRQQRSMPPTVQWVVKISKFCNLRCRYCYEFKDLADRRRMTLYQIGEMFGHIATDYRESGRQMDFVWHGGEPLLIEESYYASIFVMQKQILGSAGLRFTNSIQTNLTRLTPDIIALLAHNFTHIGVSIDLFGGHRVTPHASQVEYRVIENIQRLREAGVKLGCITVLSQSTVNHIPEIYRFFTSCGLPFRLLPIYRTSYEGQQDQHALSADEIRDGLMRAVDLWFESDSDVQVRPIQDYILNAIRFLNIERVESHIYDRTEAEIVFVVDTDGMLYSNADAYDPLLAHGNIFQQDLEEMRQSSGYLRSVEACARRMAATCHQCKFHGACSGYFMGEATPEQRYEENGRLACLVAQPVQDYILSWLARPDIARALSEDLSRTAWATHPALET